MSLLNKPVSSPCKIKWGNSHFNKRWHYAQSMRTVMATIDDRQKRFLPLDYRQCCSHILKMHWCSEHKILFYLCQKNPADLSFYYRAITVILEGEEFMRHSVRQQHSAGCMQSLWIYAQLLSQDSFMMIYYTSSIYNSAVILLVIYIHSYWNWWWIWKSIIWPYSNT